MPLILLCSGLLAGQTPSPSKLDRDRAAIEALHARDAAAAKILLLVGAAQLMGAADPTYQALRMYQGHWKGSRTVPRSAPTRWTSWIRLLARKREAEPISILSPVS
jgi:hypothetical protein